MSERIGPDYEVIRELRRGPWVTVYEARHRVLGRRTLVKWLNPEHKGDEEMAGRLRREARLGASVGHPNAARIYGVGEADGRPYVAIEWIEGEDLESMLVREAPLSFEKVLRLALDLLLGLSAIHEAGVVHRDLSPANVRITSRGIARITDFGLATGRYDPRFTMPGSVVGTPGYLAPEQAAGHDIDHRADLFTCGVLLHEALTGKPLFRDKDLISTVKRVQTLPAPPIHTLVEDLPEGFSTWLSKLLEKDPEERWQSALDAKEALDEMIAASSSINESELESLTRSRPRFSIPATLLPAIALGLLLAIVINMLRPEPRERIEPPEMVLDSARLRPASQDTSPVNLSEAALEDSVAENQQDMERSEPGTQAVRTELTAAQPGTTREEAPDPEPGEYTETQEPEGSAGEPIPAVHTGEGTLVVRTTPWAVVYVDGQRIGSTPVLDPVILTTGEITLTFDNPGFPPIVLDTTIIPDDTTEIEVDLLRFVGEINFTAIPWARVYVDDVPHGETPLGRAVYLSPGRHRVRMSHPEFGFVEREFEVSAGETATISINMIEEGTPIASSDDRSDP